MRIHEAIECTGAKEKVTVTEDSHEVDGARVTMFEEIDGELGLDDGNEVASFKFPDHWWWELTGE